MTIGEREKEGEGGGFSRDECLVIAARGSTVPLSFIHLPLAASREQIGPGSVHYQCIAARPSIELFDAASKQAESPSSLSPFGIYIDEYDAVCVCVCVSQRALTRVNRVASILFRLLSLFVGWTVRNFSPPGVERSFYARFLLVEKGGGVSKWREGGKKIKCRSV